jgi:hypothetical protein
MIHFKEIERLRAWFEWTTKVKVESYSGEVALLSDRFKERMGECG